MPEFSKCISRIGFCTFLSERLNTSHIPTQTKEAMNFIQEQSAMRKRELQQRLFKQKQQQQISHTEPVKSQQEEIEALKTSVAALQEDMQKLKTKFHHKQQKTSTHLIPYDSLKDEQASFIQLSTDDNLRVELFLLGFGSGHGTHLSLKVTGDLPTPCHFEVRVVNSSDDEESRKKSTDFEETSGAHIVEFPKLIEKDVVENEALGYKRKGILKITVALSWDEVFDP